MSIAFSYKRGLVLKLKMNIMVVASRRNRRKKNYIRKSLLTGINKKRVEKPKTKEKSVYR